MKKRVIYSLKLLLLIAVLGIVTWLVYAFQVDRKLVRVGHSITSVDTDEISLEYTPVLTDTDVITMQIEAQYDYLNAIKVPVLLGEGSDDYALTDEQKEAQPALRLCVLDDSGKKLWSGDAELSNVLSGNNVRFDTDLSVTTGQTYTLQLSVVQGKPASGIELPSVQLPVSSENPNKDDRIGHAWLNEEELNGSIDVNTRYLYQSAGHFWLMLIADVLILLLFLFGGRAVDWLYAKRPSLERAGSGLLWVMTPPVIWYLTQRMVNWTFSPDFSYQIWTLLFYYMLLLLLTFCFRQIKVGAIAFSLILTLLALTDYFLIVFRSNPFMLTDLRAVGTAATVVTAYEFTISLKRGILLLAALTWVLLIAIGLRGTFSRRKRVKLLRSAGIVLSAVCLISINQIKLQNGWLRQSDFFNMSFVYGKKGFLTSLIAQYDFIKTEKPAGYSSEAAQEVLESAAASYDESEAEETDNLVDTASAVTPENIIIVMNESFWDPWTLGDVEVEEDFLPYWHSLLEQDNVSTGLLYMPVFGSGTSNSEYEVLTGNVCHFLSADLMAYELNCAEPEYGLADILKSQGYRTVAMHPNRPAAWNRQNVYEWMGFDEFIHINNWDVDKTKIRQYVSDASVYREIEYLTENKEEGEKLFTFCVTIQNHGGYVDTDFPSTISLEYGEQYARAEQFFTLMQESDQALQDFISYYEKVDEPTMIVFFGDHQPSIESDLRSAIKNTVGNTDPNDPDWRYRDSYMIWTNYDTTAVKDQTMSANYLGAYALQMAGLELTDYQKLTLEAMESVPVIGITGYRDAEGTWHSYSEEDKTVEEMDALETVLNNYSIAQYNHVNDRSNTLSQYFTLGDSSIPETESE